jgi:predicted small metal-binding protein
MWDGGAAMTKIINCDCGFVVRGADDDELVANAQAHAGEAHGIELTREQALAIATPAG